MKLPKMKFTAAGDMLIQRVISTEYEGFDEVAAYIKRGDARFFNFESIIYREGLWGSYSKRCKTNVKSDGRRNTIRNPQSTKEKMTENVFFLTVVFSL